MVAEPGTVPPMLSLVEAYHPGEGGLIPPRRPVFSLVA
jgi:hypothetical protein